jgi:hypothetical protein
MLLAEHPVNQIIVRQRNPLPIDLPIPPLIYQLANRLTAGISVSDVGLDPSEHVDAGFVDTHEDSVVELAQSEEAEDADDLGVELVDTADSDDKGELRLGWDVEGAGLFGVSTEVDLLADPVLMGGLVGLATLQDVGTAGLVGDATLLSGLEQGLLVFGVTGFLLLEGFGFGWCFLGFGLYLGGH